MKILQTLCAGTAVIFANGVVAQTTEPPADSQQPMTSEEMPSNTMTDDGTEASSFTDSEVNSFAEAVLKIQVLEGDPATKQAEAARIVAEAGIDAETYTAIGTAMQTDPELAERVRTAAASMQQPQPAG